MCQMDINITLDLQDIPVFVRDTVIQKKNVDLVKIKIKKSTITEK